MSRSPKPSRHILGPNDCLLVLGLCSFLMTTGCQDSGTSLAPKPEETQTQQADSQNVAAQGSEKVAITQEEPAKSVPATESTVELSKPIRLLDGGTLDFWEEIEFGGEGAIEVEDGVINFEMGDPFTGIASTLEDLPKTNFEVSLEARKIEGVDFFCGLTFPVADSHCTLILGGWGGDVCGLSCIDGKDASTNETSSSLVFEKNKWYQVRVRVEPNRISAWVDDKQIVDADTAGRKISLRGDTSLCEPMGIASFQTQAQYKNIELRKFKAKENLSDSPK